MLGNTRFKITCWDDELTPKDYYYLLLERPPKRRFDSSANRGLVVAESKFASNQGPYYDYYMKESPVQAKRRVQRQSLCQHLIQRKNGIWFSLLAGRSEPYVNDGFRDEHGRRAIRSDFLAIWKAERECLAHIPTFYLAGSYLDNYQAAKEARSLRFIKQIKKEVVK